MADPRVVEAWSGLASTASPLRAGDRVLLVGAHPDDETIGAGRLVADHVGPVAALTLSLGERCVPELDPVAMGQRRTAEWRDAVRALDADVRLLDDLGPWPDGGLHQHEAAIQAALDHVLADYDVVVTPWCHDPHPDHRVAGRACSQAAAAHDVRVVEYPVWAPYWTSLETVAELDYAMCSTATSERAEQARTAALAAYVSQTGPLVAGAGPVVPQAMLERHGCQLVAVPR